MSEVKTNIPKVEPVELCAKYFGTCHNKYRDFDHLLYRANRVDEHVVMQQWSLARFGSTIERKLSNGELLDVLVDNFFATAKPR